MTTPPNQGKDADRGWFRSGTQSYKVLVALTGGVTKELEYTELDGMAIFEGDISLGSLAKIEAARSQKRLLPQGIARKGPQFRWPGGIVPFQIAPGFIGAERIRTAIDHWQTNTKIRLVERTGANVSQYRDYVSFEDRGACYSDVGKQGNRQVVSIGPSCPTGSVIHEIGHVVGLWHEQSRSDRDLYVTIENPNILSSELYNFEQHVQDGEDLGAYDYGSIMHYPSGAFSRNGQPTIRPKNGAPIGQRTALSAGDREAVKNIYPELYA